MNTPMPLLDPLRVMLLVMDYEPAILANVPDSETLLSLMAGTLASARARGLPIGYVRIAFRDSDYAAIPETNLALKDAASSKALPEIAPETQIDAAIAPLPGDLVVRKTRVGAFSTTDLSRQLQDRKINTLILAGVATSGVVLSTLREAADLDYRIFVLEDLTRDRDQEVQETLIKKVFPRQAYVIQSSDLQSLLKT